MHSLQYMPDEYNQISLIYFPVVLSDNGDLKVYAVPVANGHQMTLEAVQLHA